MRGDKPKAKEGTRKGFHVQWKANKAILGSAKPDNDSDSVGDLDSIGGSSASGELDGWGTGASNKRQISTVGNYWKNQEKQFFG